MAGVNVARKGMSNDNVYRATDVRVLEYRDAILKLPARELK